MKILYILIIMFFTSCDKDVYYSYKFIRLITEIPELIEEREE